MKCQKHPKYIGRRKPNSTCEECWYIWFNISEDCQNCGCYLNTFWADTDPRNDRPMIDVAKSTKD